MPERSRRPVVLVLALYYPPSENAGGAMRTIVNMVERLADRFDFRVVTSDRDLGSDRVHESVDLGAWNAVGRARVRYVDVPRLGLRSLARLVDEVQPDAVYLNSLFSPLAIRYLTLRRLGRVRGSVVLAPEGELAPDALAKSGLRKRLFLRAARFAGLHRNILWKTAAAHEADMVARLLPADGLVRLAPNMPPHPDEAIQQSDARPPKRPGEVRLVFLARIVPIKNLEWVLRALETQRGRVTLDVFGPAEDAEYWAKCQASIATLPANVTVEYRGLLPPDDVPRTLAAYHFMILPTLGENFGHVIIEALAAGCPVVVSDRTPWRDLAAKGIGWDLPLEDIGPWRATLGACVAMDGAAHDRMSDAARSFASGWLRDPAVEQATVDVLTEATAAAV